MRPRNTAILVVIAAALAAYFFFVEQPRQRRSVERSAMTADLAAFDIDDVTAVTIERPDVTLDFARTRGVGGWLMTNPLSDRASDGAVNRLLALLAEAEIGRDLGLQNDLSPYGLDEPAARITVAMADGNTVVALDVGDLTVEKYYAYATRRGSGENSSVLLIPTGIRRYALGEPYTYRSSRLTEFDLESVKRFTVAWPDSEVTWVRDEGGGWSTTVAGHTIRGRKRDIEDKIRRARSLRVAEFVPVDQVAVVKPFDTPPRSFRVTLDDGGEQQVRFGRRLESRNYAGARLDGATGERVVLIDTTALELFATSVPELRDRRLLNCDLEQLGKLELMSPDVNVTLVRHGSDWSFPNPALEAPERQLVRRAILAVFDLQYGRVLDEDPSRSPSNGLSNPDIQLTIFDRGGRRIDQLSCTRAGGARDAYVASSGYAAVVAEINMRDLDAVLGIFKTFR